MNFYEISTMKSSAYAIVATTAEKAIEIVRNIACDDSEVLTVNTKVINVLVEEEGIEETSILEYKAKEAIRYSKLLNGSVDWKIPAIRRLRESVGKDANGNISLGLLEAKMLVEKVEPTI